MLISLLTILIQAPKTEGTYVNSDQIGLFWLIKLPSWFIMPETSYDSPTVFPQF